MHAARLRAWAAEHVLEPFVAVDEDGREAIHAHDHIAIRPDWLQTHGHADMIREDGTLHLDGGTIYRPMGRTLTDGREVYERI